MNTRLPDDGAPLVNGLTLCHIRTPEGAEYRDAVYRCSCGREQKAYCAGFPGGLSVGAAENVGWRKIDDKWNCPFCTGNTANLFGVFSS